MISVCNKGVELIGSIEASLPPFPQARLVAEMGESNFYARISEVVEVFVAMDKNNDNQ